MPPKQYFGQGEAREARLQQMRDRRQAERHRIFLDALAAAADDGDDGPVIPKYVPTNTHCPGSIAFTLLYGARGVVVD